MGFIADLAKNKTSGSFPALNQGVNNSRAIWRDVFRNSTHKEEAHPLPAPNGGSFGRSLVSTDASMKRLLQAMRSMAPGGWTDDRWEQSKHMVGISYVAIHRQNELLSQASFQVFEKDKNHPDGKRPATSEGAEKLIQILEKPNPDDSFGDLVVSWNTFMDLYGMALTWMVPNQLGTPMELYPIPTPIAIPQPAINPDFPDGFYRIQPVYPYGPFSSYPTPASAVGAPIDARWMMRFKYIHPLLRYEGYSPQTAMRLHMDEIESMDRSRWYSMKRTFRPNVVLNFDEMEGSQPLDESEIARLKAEFENEFFGPENSGKMIVGTPGGKFEEFGTSPVDMDYQGGWEQLVSFVLGAFGITKQAAGMIEDSSYATLFATLKQLYWLTLEPKVDRFAQKLTRHLAPFYGDNLIIEMKCKRIDDHEVNFTRLDKLTQGKAITKNELRKELDMPITNKDWGEEIAGTEKQEEQPGMPGAEGQQPQGQEEGGGLAALLGGSGNGEETEDQETEEQRPDTGTLNEGSLGPRMKTMMKKSKAFTEKETLSFYEKMMKSMSKTNGVLTNGH